MGKLMLLLVTVSTIVGMLLHGSIEENISGADERFVKHGSKVLARELALTGLNDGMQTAMGHFAMGTYTGPTGAQGVGAVVGSHDGGSYSVDLDGSGSTVSITSMSSYGSKTYTVERIYEYVLGGGGSTPFMENAISCGGNLNVNHNLNIFTATENADIHANGNITFNGGTSDIKGFGTYGGSLALNNGQTATDIFDPFSNPGGEPVHSQVAPIDFPIFDASSYSGIATQTTVGDVNLAVVWVVVEASGALSQLAAGSTTNAAMLATEWKQMLRAYLESVLDS